MKTRQTSHIIPLKAALLACILPCVSTLTAQNADQDSVTVLDVRDPVKQRHIADPPITSTHLPPLPVAPRIEEGVDSGKEDTLPAGMEELRKFIVERFTGTGVEVRQDGPYLVLRLPESRYRSGSTRMPAALRRHLPPLSEAVRLFGGQFDLLIEGHADKGAANKSVAANWTVAHGRTEAIRRELMRLQIPERSIGLVSRGAGLSLNTEPSSLDRRVEFVFAPRRNTIAAGDGEHLPQQDIPKQTPRVKPEPLREIRSGNTGKTAALDEPLEVPVSLPVIAMPVDR